MNSSKFEFITQLDKFIRYANERELSFPEIISNYLCQELEIEALSIFEVVDNNKLKVVGKSSEAKKSLQVGKILELDNIDLSKEFEFQKLYTTTKIEVNVSDFLLNQSSYLFKAASKSILIIIAKKEPITTNEKAQIEKTFNLFSFLFSSWFSGIDDSQKKEEFTNVVEESLTELRNLANSILGFVNYFNNESISSSQKEYLTSIKKSAQGIILNINDLIELVKIESKNVITTKNKVELIQLMSEIIETFKGRLGSKKLIYNLEADKKLFNPIAIDEQKFRYVFTMLLFIATAQSNEGEIFINVKILDKSKLSVEITDNANIYDKESIENFFKPFFISKKSEFKSSAISGLSLTLVKSFVNLMGGELNILTYEKGNKYTFTIRGEIMSDFESTLSQLPKPTTKNKVLVIEDDYATSKLLNNYLNKWGYDPLIVSSEHQAFNVIEKEQLLAVILDIELPQVNGLELLKKIHEHPKTKNLPVIVCSVEPEQQKAFMMGAVEYFIKPINYNYLVEVLTSYKLRKNSNVLCVDDDLPTLNLVKQAIEQAGFNPLAFNISAEVMDAIKDKDIDLAIVDLDMPTPNGFELIKLIKSEKKFAKLPIIIYTGKENYKEDLKQIEGLFDDLLEKRSTNIEDLADTINSMINRYETLPPVEDVIKKEGGLKILLAEDYKHSQIIVTRLLKKNGFEDIVVVENGEDAIKMAKEKKFDLILMDMQMPIMNGFEATEKIREFPEYKNTPIIALTAFAMKGDREKCIEAGATDYIPKPIDSKEFIEKVKYYTNSLV
ncbi:response regulator [Stygiobacter electus]|uniref:Response regulator n=1 Tax=Stygiobacter electus TaxID=3032292 RepID=A0AAE3P302_9BACT|nr:response regulator [Stygiobacter electus]MDF1612158.1 response regulator [Stygiobacter electus]